jgi:hypothetical protein
MNKHQKFVNANRHMYADLLQKQNGVCAICGRPPSNRKLNLDHDHKEMKIRGLLCYRCNKSLPYWVDIQWLLKALDYLKSTQ